MGVRPNPLHHGRYWDASENVVAGCQFADHSCLNCYAMLYAAGIHTANDIELYRGTTEVKHERLTWSGKFNVLPPEHPNYTFPLRWRGTDPPVMGVGKPYIIWVNSMADLFVPHPEPFLEWQAAVHQRCALAPPWVGADQVPRTVGGVLQHAACLVAEEIHPGVLGGGSTLVGPALGDYAPTR